MSLKIHQDHSRFKQIVRGKIKANLRRYVQKGEMLGKRGKDTISIPIPFIDIPHFKYGHREQGGVGQGEGEVGQQLGPGSVQPGDGHKAGQGEGDHALEVDVSLDELASILGEELQLPNIERRGKEQVVAQKIRYTGVNTTGPESLRHFKRTFKQALRRQIALGTYDPRMPIIIPTREDRRYRTFRMQSLPETNAVIIYMMDVSGSMGDEQKEIVRIESFWLDTWLRHQYKGLECRYIIHDAVAREVDRETFFHTRESGGTMISSAYKLCRDIIRADYPPGSWNIYPFHFSDGDNWSADDTRHCIDMLRSDILPGVNQFAYGQVESPYGSGQFIKDLRETVGDEDNVSLSEIADKDAIYQSIKDFLGEGALMPKSLTPRLAELKETIEGYARGFGLDFFETVFEMLGYDELNMVASYGGFPNRYPHWRWGMEYEQLSKGYEYGLSKIYELVINNDPCYAYLLESNAEVDQKLVMAHVYGHCDFFKNNFYFQHTNRRMMDEMANHATRVRRWVDKVGIEKVEDFIDRALSLENLIDYHSPYIRRSPDPKRAEHEEKSNERVEGFKVDREYMRGYVNPTEFLESQRKKVEDEKAKKKHFPERPQRDVLLFLLEHAPLEPWEFDVLAILREEAYYFAPQGQTKIMNEGWACLRGDMRVFTDRGLVTMQDLVQGVGSSVSDGERHRQVYDRQVIPDHPTITVKTRRGFTLCGSNNHRVLLADGTSWKRLDELTPGEKLSVGGGRELWPTEEPRLTWTPHHRIGLADVATETGVSLSTVLRHRAGRTVRTAATLNSALQAYDAPENQELPQSLKTRGTIRLPASVTPALGAFLGYLVGDGHISRVKRNLGITTGDEAQAETFVGLAQELFGLPARLVQEDNKLRVLLHSETLSDFLIEGLGMTQGPSAREKHVPELVLRSPEPVVRAFLRAYFDCDGHGGAQGVILSTMSDALAEQVQLLLLNYGILSRKRRQTDGCWHLHVAGASAQRFSERVGFGLSRKQEALQAYLDGHRWMKEETWEDEVVSLEGGREDVYDISVTETHRYAAAGLVNHNSYWHSTIMTKKALTADEVIDYADHHSGTLGTRPGSLNPYKLGIELYRDIEERWNKGRFGKEWDDCDDLRARRAWDKNLGLGREKIFEVRKHYNDVTFIDTFLTAEFALEQKLFVYGFNEKRNSWEILDREFRKVKNKLLAQLTNFGQPIIEVVDGNFENRGELLLAHKHDGQDLKPDYARETLRNLQTVWHRPCNLITRLDGKGVCLRYDGQNHTEKKVDL